MSCGITGHSPPPHPAVSRSMAGWRKAIGGSARRSRGVRIQANAQTPIRLYRAVKTQGRRRKKGEDRPSGASSADPDGDRGDEPNSPITAGASEFVLLAAEKNEQAQTSFSTPPSKKWECHSCTPLPYLQVYRIKNSTIDREIGSYFRISLWQELSPSFSNFKI